MDQGHTDGADSWRCYTAGLCGKSPVSVRPVRFAQMLVGGRSGIKIKQSERLKSVHIRGALHMDTSLDKLLS